MLLELSVKHLAVIEEVQLSFRRGFHVLTGETGTGKSIIIDALSLIIGGRASSDLVRHGCDKAEIEALFDLPVHHPVFTFLQTQGIDTTEESTVIIRREITSNGKSTARINGQLVMLATLKAVGEMLVNIHGQHEHQSLLRVDRHLEWLDEYGGEKLLQKKKTYQMVYQKFKKISNEIAVLQDEGKTMIQFADLYRYQSDEIQAASLKVKEEEMLIEEKQKLANAERLYTAVNESYEALYGNKQGLDWITKSKQRISDVTKFDPVALNPLLDQLQSAYFQLEDAAYQLRDYREKIEFNPNKLDQLEQRLQLIHSLKRKYGETVEKIIEYAASIRVKVDNLEQQEERIASLTHEKNKIELELREVANALTAIRLVTAKQLSTSLMENLKDLHMDKTIFTVEHVLTSGQWPSEGVDRMEFMIAPNPGEPLKSIARIASGGELSRIMLALKSLFVAVDHVPVLIFDEVDTGVSGRAAQAIAEKMAALAKHAQVFSVTHLPQVACMADHHYAIEKRVHVDRTYTLVTPLEQPDRINELARMLGGVEITESAIQHAQEMLNLATVHKANWNEGR